MLKASQRLVVFNQTHRSLHSQRAAPKMQTMKLSSNCHTKSAFLIASSLATLLSVALASSATAATLDSATAAGGTPQVPQYAPVIERRMLIAGLQFDESMLPKT